MAENPKAPPFLVKMRKSVEWVASTREDQASFMEGADAMYKLILDHYLATPMLNPAMVGHEKKEALTAYYEQKIHNLENRLKKARAQIGAAESDEIKKLRQQLASANGELKRLRPTADDKLSKQEKNSLKNRLAEAQCLLGKQAARIIELAQYHDKVLDDLQNADA